MNTSTKLILLLIVSVGAMMTLAGYYILRQREAILVTAMHNEVRAHALTLQITLEDAYRAGRITDAQRLIDRLSDNPKIHSVILFEAAGRAAMLSDPLVANEIRQPPEVTRVIRTGETAEVVRRLHDKDVFSIIMPLRVSAESRGAFEITQPISFIEADIRRARRDIAMITIALFVMIVLIVLTVMRRSLFAPIRGLLAGATALGRGDFNYRVKVPENSREFARLAQEFNRMADNLSEQRGEAAREAEERLKLERDLRHSERLASVGRLAAGVAHEMGAPLNVIKGRLQLLKAAPEMTPEKRARNLTIIGAQADSITRIVRQLLNLSSPYNLRRTPIELSQLLADAVEAIEAEAAKKRLSVVLQPAGRLHIEGDRDLLLQVIMNLLVNAMHATPAGGRVSVEALPAQSRKDDRSFVSVRIADNGPGIATEHLPHIFDPFFTTKDVGEGTGLGLAVARHIIDEHGGWVDAFNKTEGGAVFTLYLPEPAAGERSNRPTGEREGRTLEV